MKEILKSLIEIPSVSSNKEDCKRSINFVKDIAEKNGLETKVFEKNDVYSLVIGKDITKNPKIMLNGHLDVVPASKDMFRVRIEGDKMYGRGTSDMKGGDVAMLIALIELAKEGTNPDALLILTTDEELGGFNGVKNIVDLGFKSKIVFIPDGGSDAQVCTDEKGVLHILLKADGKSAHGSRPWIGENAVLKLIDIFRVLEKYFEKRWGKATKDDNWKPTLNLGMLTGGEAANQVPNAAEMKIDIRFPSPVTLNMIEDIVNKALNGKKGITLEILSTGSPLHTDVDNLFVKSWKELFKRDIKFVKESGASDARFFAEKNIPVILTKPRSSEPHIDNEWVDLKSLEEFKNVLKEWLKVNG